MIRNALSLVFRLVLVAGLLFGLFSTSGQAAPVMMNSALLHTPSLVKDINMATETSRSGEFTALGDLLYFSADDGLHGQEVWRSEGAPANTSLLMDLVPGSVGSNPYDLKRLDATHLVFIAQDASEKNQVYITNDTGTQVVQLTAFSEPKYGINILWVEQEHWIYIAVPGSSGRDLWRSDGTPGGTGLLAPNVVDNYTGQSVAVPFQGWLYLAAPGTAGRELHRINHTVDALVLVKDLCPGECGSNTGNVTAGADRLYFTATTPDQGDAIWYTTGPIQGQTEDPVDVMADLVADNSYRVMYMSLTPTSGGLFFIADDFVDGRELYFTAGTPETTHMVIETAPGAEMTSWPNLVGLLGDTLFFSVYATQATTNSTIIYKTTGSGAVALPTGGRSIVDGPAQIGDSLYFILSGSSSADELWKFSESGAPEYIFTFPGIAGSPYVKIGVWNNMFVLPAFAPGFGYEPWLSDGTALGTHMLADINQQQQRFSGGTDLSVVYKGAVYFPFYDGIHKEGIFRTDGSAGGTQFVGETRDEISGLKTAAVSNGYLYFIGVDSQGQYDRGLWRTDGTEAGTQWISDDNPSVLVNADDRLFFPGYDNASATQGLFAMNPGDEQPKMILDAYPFQIGARGGECLFTQWEANPIRWELWKSDGTENGTQQIASFPTSFTYADIKASFPMVNFDGRQFFFAPALDDSVNISLYATDGASITQITAGDGTIPSFPSYPTAPLATSDELYFGGIDGTNAVMYKLSKGSSQAEGIHVAALLADYYVSDQIPVPLAELNGGLVFYSMASDNRLFLYDGTEVKLLCPECGYQSAAFNRAYYASAEGKLYFSAMDAEHGWELWVSDGTAAGTRLLADILPGPESSDPGHFIHFGHQVLFFANDGQTNGGHGYELWQVDLNESRVYLPVVTR
jgi:ELWxxDGT repeat protein